MSTKPTVKIEEPTVTPVVEAPAEAPVEAPVEAPAVSQGSEIAAAIREGLKESKDDNFALQAEPGVEHRFSLVKATDTGAIMIRENETGTLSSIQLLSIEEKESSIQNTEVEEI